MSQDHAKLGQFKDLNDCLQRHVCVSLQKVGQFPCPMCQVDEQTGAVFTTQAATTRDASAAFDQQAVIASLIDKNMDNSLYLDTYEQLRAHILDTHPKFNADAYFVCRQCGQVFLNRYKLSCHLFNVHSGKRKRRSAAATSTTTTTGLMSTTTLPKVLTVIGGGGGGGASSSSPVTATLLPSSFTLNFNTNEVILFHIYINSI